MPNAFRTEVVLVVDDEPLVLKYTASVITGLGYKNVFKAGTFAEAAAIFREHAISLLISDVSLPDGDGRQLLREALQHEPRTAGVLITGFSMDLRLPSDLQGKVQLLEKPFTADDISHILADYLEKKPVAAV